MRFSHRLITAAPVYPVSIAEVKLSARVVQDEEDAILETWIAAATREAENYQRRAYITQTWAMSWDCWPDMPVSLWRAPLQSVDWVRYYDTDDTEYTLSTDDYFVDITSSPGAVSLNYGAVLPSTVLRPRRAVTIQYVAGYGTTAAAVPPYVKDAIGLYCAWRYENRASEAGRIPRQFYDLLNMERLFQ